MTDNVGDSRGRWWWILVVLTVVFAGAAIVNLVLENWKQASIGAIGVFIGVVLLNSNVTSPPSATP